MLKLLTSGAQAGNVNRPALPELPVSPVGIADEKVGVPNRLLENYNNLPRQQEFNAIMSNLLESGNHQALA